MEKLIINGGKRLEGSVSISGAKNSAVALIPAALLADGPVVIENLPHIQDVEIYCELLKEMGADVLFEDDWMEVDGRPMQLKLMPNGRIKKLRASYYLWGALLAKFGEAHVGLPGGCDLGPRPVDLHIKGFEALGARVENQNGVMTLRAKNGRLKGARIYLDLVSVGATINIMLAASKAEGVTIIENAAREPEIVDVATLLNNMGAKIKGAGTDIIRIEGVERLRGCRHTIIPDRIEAGTYMIAAAATRGSVTLENVIPKHLESVTAKLREIGAEVLEMDDCIQVNGREVYRAIDVKTSPYPGFPTDLQQPITTLLTLATGTSVVTDNIYSARFRHVDELRRMGANLKVEGRSAVIEGTRQLNGAKVVASDLRAGAALVIAGLATPGTTELEGLEHIDRGYENLVSKLQSLGADVKRIGLPRMERHPR
ncbi:MULTISPECIES: UDP-N-acetylglucosamine 1-carboxyvinyltransferase [Bacillales]|jgi:UDP-N-acetylglucosamine 1-carboxyvinyltransferase|uniref:UDP-N-acetylglucosamine 1-carboxyvinyltransferase n=1 Tax=Brevibacillus aydinogluensis TaxID=927786 RepID=A0AA48RFM5_9BACL|nr:MULTISPECIES: UDP-N-acetylglucosamine 1-carboxyvinyltransferase [Bacillales]REK60642.1 MAG: UDP-N-acetylglucosamine 1-carboxyvinyltransferase [Brevibacillus sp.]MBR8659767.1 UDP-N-acetylglucosamine 1-carboxyvinyltransferase [Brevibacillus sp. NL20B1]MDT3416632.1 UDP-N-acetylglucosamine 1-carboxyvinyltransferase [Brevibacillus aydinogluensis]NNV01249.1 UDP-N-acetylglucosamine 1-carboxyvinyltransferase [Brevibacillus sp. MCWH]UFJ62048.1 UDP-N-acetylglucosamine 1-carboxyvinyltransferase [Anoxy